MDFARSPIALTTKMNSGESHYDQTMNFSFDTSSRMLESKQTKLNGEFTRVA